MALAGVNFENVFGFISDIGKIGKDLREAITGETIIDPAKMQDLANQAAEIEIRAAEANNTLLIAQMEINKIEAQSSSKFIAGWRPFIGWICGFAFAYHFIVYPIAQMVISFFITGFKFPVFDIQTLISVLLGMLGLGLYRSLEKKWDVQDKH